MPKRSSEERIDRYYRKIKRLEARKKHYIIYTDEEDPPDENVIENNENEVNNSQMESDPQQTEQVITADPMPTNSASIPTPAAPDSAETPVHVDPELLAALGPSTSDTPMYGEKIHCTLVDLWIPLLKKGFANANDREKFVNQQLIPENCKLLQAPTLNAEISAAISDTVRGRDKKLQNFQQQLGSGTSAINRGMDLLLRNEDKSRAMSYLSDGCRLLTDLHCLMTKDRIKLLAPSLDKPFMQVTQDSERDETLFGSSLSEKIKASKAIERQGLQIKKPQIKTASHAAVVRQQAYQGNWTGPPRYQYQSRGRGGPRRAAPAPQRRYQPPPQAPGPSRFPTSQSRFRAPPHP